MHFSIPLNCFEAPCCETFRAAIMKAIFYAQLNPQKTIEQLINDRSLYRILILTFMILAACG